MTMPEKTDPRVLALAERELHWMPEWFDAADRADMANQSACIMIGKCEAAGLLVLADNDEAVMARAVAAVLAYNETLHEPRHPVEIAIDTARAVLAALRSSPPAEGAE